MVKSRFRPESTTYSNHPKDILHLPIPNSVLRKKFTAFTQHKSENRWIMQNTNSVFCSWARKSHYKTITRETMLVYVILINLKITDKLYQLPLIGVKGLNRLASHIIKDHIL